MWTLNTILSHVQDLVGEPQDSFYSLSLRKNYVNRAQDEMIRETLALTNEAEISVAIEQHEIDLPEDFLTFSKEQPYWEDSLNELALDLKAPGLVEVRYPTWRNPDKTSGTPEYLVQRNGKLILVPTPRDAGTVKLPYVVAPTPLEDPEDEPFNGSRGANVFAVGIAYRVAHIIMLPRAPQYAKELEQLYVREERKMRTWARSSPQHAQSIRPTAYLRGRGYGSD